MKYNQWAKVTEHCRHSLVLRTEEVKLMVTEMI